jgi:hypothetical protein
MAKDDSGGRTWRRKVALHEITMDIQRLSIDEALRLRHIRLRALADAPDAFGSTYAEVSAHPLEIWRQQLQEIVTFVAVHDGEDVGIVRCASDE